MNPYLPDRSGTVRIGFFMTVLSVDNTTTGFIGLPEVSSSPYRLGWSTPRRLIYRWLGENDGALIGFVSICIYLFLSIKLGEALSVIFKMVEK